MKPGIRFTKWERWFAWRPVRLIAPATKTGHRWIWREYVERRWVIDVHESYREYRLPGSTFGDGPSGLPPPASEN